MSTSTTNLQKSGFTITFLDNLILARNYKEAKECISQMFEKDGFSKEQLLEVFIRAALIYNRCDNPLVAERFAKKGLALLLPLKQTPNYGTKCWRYLEQISKSLSKQNRKDEKEAILRGACDLPNLGIEDQITILCRYTRCLISSKKYCEAAQWLRNGEELANTPILKAKVYYHWLLLNKECEEWDKVIEWAEKGCALIRESDRTDSRLLPRLAKELYKAKIIQELKII